jgi:tetratricopeptide (TPR) repeat protein
MKSTSTIDVASARGRGWLAGLLLASITLLAYQPVWHAGFIWDDDRWTTSIHWLLRDWRGLWPMWSQPTALQQYYPLSATTFWVDYHLWGYWPLPYHVENVLLHITAALLFWKLLQRLEVPGALLAAGVFALHPLMVESVAWVTERKNVLSLVLYLAALLVYGRFTNFWKEELPPRRWIIYAGAALLFLAAILAKTTAFSFPAVILLLIWWKRGHVRLRQDVWPVLPFFVLSVCFCLGVAWLEKTHVGANGPDFVFSLPERCLIAGRALWFYPGKLLWPADQSFVYPRWHLDTHSLAQWSYPMTAIGGLLALWFARRSIGRGPVAAVYFYAGTLFPFLGFVNGFCMRFSFVWDHLSYFSNLGLIALGSALVARGTAFLRNRSLVYGFATLTLLLLAGLTWRQCGMYANEDTLWRATLARNPDSFMPHNNLGADLFRRGHTEEAIVHFRKVIQLEPDYEMAHCNLGTALSAQGRLDEAIIEYGRAVELNPRDARAHNNLANALATKGRVSEALAHYEVAWKLPPKSLETAFNLAWLLATCPDDSVRNGWEAVKVAQEGEQLTGGKNPIFISTLGAAYAEVGQFPEAITAARRALALAREQHMLALADALSSQIALYMRGSPFRDMSDAKAPATSN